MVYGSDRTKGQKPDPEPEHVPMKLSKQKK
jgi:hypothetical protein